MKIIHISILFLLNYLSILDIVAQSVFSARSSSLSGAGVILDDAHAVSQNPAQNTAISRTVVSAGIQSVYMIPDLNSMSCSFILPIKKSHAAALHYARIGTKYFYDQAILLSYGIKISPKLNLGAQIERRNKFYSSETDLAMSVWSATLGLSASPLKGFKLGASISNPTKSKWNNSHRTELTSILQVGSSITLSTKTTIFTQVIKESSQAASYSAGIEYMPIERLLLRTGVSSNPFRPSFGAGLAWKNTRVDFSISTQSYLGFSPGISIQQKFR